ncbi:MAG TPA: hypothetical protein VFX53_05075 [Pedococcus sp.]|nr:hypothetical protein [Pedococcus sp.]
MNLKESRGCAKGYAWGRLDADGSTTAQREGDSSSGCQQFANAYEAHWRAYEEGRTGSAMDVRSAWETWNRTMALTLDYSDIPSDGQARRIASEWHGGQSSALYSLASCGAITPEVAGEIQREITTCDDATDLTALLIYVAFHGPRDRQEGWSGVWSDSAVRLSPTS